MKKVVILLIFVGLGACAWLLYEPYLKKHVDPILEKVTGEPAGPVKPKESEPTPTPEAPKPKPVEVPKVAEVPREAPKPVEPPKSEIDLLVEKQYPIPQLQPLLEIVDNWNNVPPRAYPEMVRGKESIPFEIKLPNGASGKSNLAPGNPLKPMRLQGDILYVSNLSDPSMRSQIHVDKTDFKEQIEKRYNDFRINMEKRILAMRASAKKHLLEKPDQVAAMKAGGKPFKDDGDPRFHPVKQSLQNGEVTAFNLDEAVGFRWNGSERLNTDKFKGTYDTVTVSYEAKTIFGVFPGEMKCLLQGGRVVGWVDPFTLEERI